METSRYGDFSARIHRRMVAERIPADGAIEITRRCPLRCVHCYNNLPAADVQARSAELTLEEHRRIIDEITAAGCLWLLYTGGEIFLRPDFPDIYTHAKHNGLLVTLFTNGTLLTPEMADCLADRRPFCIEITIYGCTAETHDRITGVAGSHKQTMRAIHLLMERRLPVALKTMALRLNRHEIPAMKRLVEEDLGLRFRFDPMVNCRADCSQGPPGARLSPREVVELDFQDPKRAAQWRQLARQTTRPVSSPEELYHCGAGVNFFAIDPYGRMAACILSQGETFDLRRRSFAEGWATVLREERGRKITRDTKCVACSLKVMCGMCPPNAQLENGDPEAPVDFLCRVAHLRAYALDLEVPPHGNCEYCGTGAGFEGLIRESAVITEGYLQKSA